MSANGAKPHPICNISVVLVCAQIMMFCSQALFSVKVAVLSLIFQLPKKTLINYLTKNCTLNY